MLLFEEFFGILVEERFFKVMRRSLYIMLL